MSVFNVRQQADDAICKIIFIHYDQRWEIGRHESARPVARGHADAPSRKRFDDFQRTPANALIRIDTDGTTLKIGLYILDKIENCHSGLLKARAPCSDDTRIDTSKDP